MSDGASLHSATLYEVEQAEEAEAYERAGLDRETIPVPASPGIPDHAPDSARSYALALDRLTGGSGSWARRALAEEFGLVLGGVES